MDAILHIAGLALVAAAVLPWSREGEWWIRIFDFPRLQLAVLGVMVLAGYRFVEPSALGYLVQVLVLAASLYQLYWIRPFTPLAPLQVPWAEPGDRESMRLGLMIANVYMPNRQAHALLEMVGREDPDLLLAVETDRWWEAQLDALTDRFPHAVRCPLSNTYGMLLYSRYPLIRPEVRFLVEEGVPSIDTAVDVPHGPSVRLYALHPRPPRPSKRQDSTNRDAELVIVGQQLGGRSDPVIVAGDLNDVAWSYTTDLFQRLSGLLDPRRGRGMYNSFHAGIPLLRFPLDHVFHSEHFRLVRLQRLGKFGSDHFPILVELSYQPDAIIRPDTPEADSDDRALARELRRRPR